eukprot:scaffold202456_cov28-Tisochrysis_lutea.AAC.3
MAAGVRGRSGTTTLDSARQRGQVSCGSEPCNLPPRGETDRDQHSIQHARCIVCPHPCSAHSSDGQAIGKASLEDWLDGAVDPNGKLPQPA